MSKTLWKNPLTWILHLTRQLLQKCLAGAAVSWLLLAAHAYTQDVSVLTHHNDNARTGAQLNETFLSPQTIKAFHGLNPLSSLPISGIVNAQPLYVQGGPFSKWELRSRLCGR